MLGMSARDSSMSCHLLSGRILTVLMLITSVVFVCFILTVNCSIPSDASGETSGQCGDDLYWTYDTQTGALTITGTDEMYDYLYSDERWGGNKIVSVSLPEGITHIGNYAFYGCTSLTSVEISDSVTSIGNYAFYGCISLASVEIPNPVRTIGDDAFEWCTALKTVYLSDSVMTIGNKAFYGCNSLTFITVDESNTTYVSVNGVLIDKRNTELVRYPAGKIDKSYNIPDSVTSVGDYSFEGCTSLTSVIFGDSVTTIGDNAFEWCTTLASIRIPDTVISIGGYAFYGCTSLTSLTLGDSVMIMGGYAFYGCISLTSIDITDHVISIGDYAFHGCTSLTALTFGNSLISIGNDAFSECTSLTSLTVPGSVSSIGDRAFFGCSSLASIAVDVSNTVYESDNGVLIDRKNAELFQYPAGKTDKSYSIPGSVRIIKEYAFRNNDNLESLVFSNGNGVSIHYGGLYDCISLKVIRISDDTAVEFQSDSIYYTDEMLHTIYVSGPDGTSVPSEALHGNVEILYGEPPSDGTDMSLIIYVVVAVVAIVAVAGVAILIMRKKNSDQ